MYHTLCFTHYLRRTVPPAPDAPNAAETALFENLRLELRRGGLVLAVLGQLRAEHYGYTLRKALAERGLPVDEGTLYPCSAGSRRRGCSPASGARRTSARSASTACRPPAIASSACWTPNGAG